MKIFTFLIIALCTLAAHADPAEIDADKAAQTVESPWQGTWTGAENNAFGGTASVRAQIKVTDGTVSGTWNVQAGGMKPITGRVDGTEANITILMGGSTIKATLVNEHTFKYSGIRGYGTLTRQEPKQEQPE